MTTAPGTTSQRLLLGALLAAAIGLIVGFGTIRPGEPYSNVAYIDCGSAFVRSDFAYHPRLGVEGSVAARFACDDRRGDRRAVAIMVLLGAGVLGVAAAVTRPDRRVSAEAARDEERDQAA